MEDSRHRPTRPYLGIGAAVIREDSVLLVRRGNEPWKGWWSLPGGVVETGEILRDAVRREMREETGLEVEPLDVVEIFESICPDASGAIAFHYVVIDFVCRVISGELAAADDAAEAAWFDRTCLPEQMTHGAPAVIEKAFEYLRQANLEG